MSLTRNILGFTTHLIKLLRFYGRKYKCNICGRPLRSFFPFSESLEGFARSAGFQYDFRRMETLNYDSCNCPFCLSCDRERLFLLFFDTHFKNGLKHFSILDFAPGPSFASAMRNKKCGSYITADLFRSDYDMTLDICDMPSLNNGQVDVVICSHVLEHVSNPDNALAEIYRVLKPGGFAIVMVPVFIDVKYTIENPDYNTDELRGKYYGQSDHVRLFAKADFVKRLTDAKFCLKMYDASSFQSELVKKYGIADNSVLYVCYKQ
jgi:SAM-dependent methyltransferase